MTPFPTDPMRQHARFMAAFCDDLVSGDYHAPRAKIVAEIARQTNEEGSVLPNKRADLMK